MHARLLIVEQIVGYRLLTMPNKKKWKHSDAKAILYQDLKEGRLPAVRGPGDPGPKQLFESTYQHLPAFQLENHGNPDMFGGRLRSLRKQFIGKHDRAALDSDALENDRELFPENFANDAGRGYPKWGPSAAKELLKTDIDDGLHKTMTPMQLHQSCPEYEEFPLHVFRNHIYQDVKGRKKHPKVKKVRMA
jgi:hypothetical protein